MIVNTLPPECREINSLNNNSCKIEKVYKLVITQDGSANDLQISCSTLFKSSSLWLNLPTGR